jgi:hypothetical protein
MRTRLRHAAVVAALIAATTFASTAFGQPVTSDVFAGMTSGEVDGVPNIRISFNLPVRYLSHTPNNRGDSIHVQFFPVIVADAGAPEYFRRESLQLPRDLPVSIEEVIYDGVVGGRPVLDVQLGETLDFEVRQGEDLRSIVIAFPSERAELSAEAATATVPVADPAGVGSERVTEMLEEGRRAMTAGEYDRAALIYTKVLAHADGDAAMEAQELLGLARERKGQRAHAKAEYEAYLERYPDSEGARRVRQRLDALVTARVEPPAARRVDPPETKPIDFETFGSAYVGYRKQNLYPRGEPTLLADSSLFTDVHVEARLRTDRYTFRGQYTGGYRYEFLEGGSDESRINSMFIEAEDHPNRLTGFVGRRSRGSSGILGRFDGFGVDWGVTERWKVGATAGLPVDSGDPNSFQTDRVFAGLHLDVLKFAEKVNAQVYAIGQWDKGLTDRVAIGTEVHYFDQGKFAAAFLDYDVYFQELNLAQLIGNWQVTKTTLLTTFLAYRLVPALTLQNALQGQGAEDLEDLRGDFSQSEMKELARDRTAHTTTLSFGVNQFLTNEIQLSADFTASDYSGTRSSENVDGIDGTGFEFSYAAQLVWNDFLRTAGIGVVGLRYFDGSDFDFLTGSIDGRFPITRDLRVNPRLRANYRTGNGAGDTFSLIPSLRLDYRIWNLNFDAEVGGEWLRPLKNSTAKERTGYSISVGVRYDY